MLTANDEKRRERVSFTHGDGYDAISKRNSVFSCRGRVRGCDLVDFEIDVYLLTTRVGPYREGGRLWLCVQHNLYAWRNLAGRKVCRERLILKSSCVKDDPGTSLRRGTTPPDVKIARRAGRCKSWRTKIQTGGTPTIDFEDTSI